MDREEKARLRIITRSPQETQARGQLIGGLLQGGEVIGLEGDLGTGKTTLIQGIGQGLGVADPITSPTFTLAATYHGKKATLHHLDLYRISDPREFTFAGLEDLVWGDGICVVEWAQKVESLLPPHRLWITLKLGFGDQREIELEAQGEKYENLLIRIAENIFHQGVLK